MRAPSARTRAVSLAEDGHLEVRVHALRYEGEGIMSFELRAPDGGDLPPFTAGAHIDVKMPGALRRSYSLTNPQTEADRYVITVHRDPASRGGSRYLCDTVRPGDRLNVLPPSNSFPLNESAERTVLIGGGIGITPLWCMIQRLEQLQKRWHLFYATRTLAKAAFLTELQRLQRQGPSRVTLTFDHEPGAQMLDIAAIVQQQPPGAHLYCCGPAGMMRAFATAARSRPSEKVHTEYFGSREAPAAQGGFEVVLFRSGRMISVRPGETILQAVLAAGIDVPRSCQQGVCGTCETSVLDGIPEHRDAVLSARERAANKRMMICCSGSRTDRLVLDL
jgi:tetrachlorobenzoquinone reductase